MTRNPVGPAVNVEAVLDGARFAGLPLLVTLCAVMVLVLDGLDIQIIGLVAPALSEEFVVAREALSPVLAASLVGMAAGALVIGAAGDRWGRRPVLLASVVLFGATTLSATGASSLESLTAWRFLTGVGLGGALPNATALMAEFAPPRWRNQAIAVAIVGAPIGGMLGAALAAQIVPAYGWRALFVVGGALPLLAAVLMYFVLPESARFLATRPARARELAALLNRIERTGRYSAEECFLPDARSARPAAGPKALFSRQLLRDTLSTWVVFGTNIFCMYVFFNWAPVVLTSLGLDLATAVRGALVFNLAGVVGALANAWVIAWFGSRWPLAALAGAGSLALLYLSQVSATSGAALPSLMAGVAAAGFTITAVQIGMYGVVAHIYPTLCRSSGVGWALGAGRLGGILSSFAGGLWLAQGGAPAFFKGVALVLLLTFFGVLAIRRHSPPGAAVKPLDDPTPAQG